MSNEGFHDPSVAYCVCQDEEKVGTRTVHTCGSCFASDYCSNMTPHPHYHVVCPLCSKKEIKDPAPIPSRPVVGIWRRIHNTILEEDTIRPEHKARTEEEMNAFISEHFARPHNKLQDAYCTILRDDDVPSTRMGPSPFVAFIDAIWRALNPSSMADYDASQSNILFKTWISNCAKFDYEQQNCDLILQDSLNIYLETE